MIKESYERRRNRLLGELQAIFDKAPDEAKIKFLDHMNKEVNKDNKHSQEDPSQHERDFYSRFSDIDCLSGEHQKIILDMAKALKQAATDSAKINFMTTQGDSNSNWAKRVRIILAIKDKDQQWLSGELNQTPNWLSQRMTGRANCFLEELDDIATALGVTTRELLQ